MLGESKTQSSLTRAALLTAGRGKTKFLLSVPVAAALISAPGLGADLDPSLLGSYTAAGLGGGGTEVKCVGQYAFVSGFNTVEVLQVGNPAAITRATGVSGGANFDVQSNRLYVAAGELKIYDVSNPASPTFLGSCPSHFAGQLDSAYPVQVKVEGTRAYAVFSYSRYVPEEWYAYEYWDGIEVVDVSNPASPIVLGTYSDGQLSWDGVGRQYGDLEVRNGYVYLSGDDGAFEVVNATNPYSPWQTYLEEYASLGSMCIDGTMLYDAMNGMVYDLADPASPELVGNGALVTGGSALFAESGEVALAGGTGTGITIWNAGSNQDPVLLGYKYIPQVVTGLHLSNGRVYCLSYGVFRVLDVSGQANPQTVGWFDSPDYYYSSQADLLVASGMAYLAAGDVQVVNVQVAADPWTVGIHESDAWAMGIARHGTYALIAQESRGVQVLDMSNPSAPVLAGRYDTPGYARAVTVSGDLAYVSDHETGAQILDISNPGNPLLLGTCYPTGYVNQVTVSGNLAYLASASGPAANVGLHIYQVSDPHEPVYVGSWTNQGVQSTVVDGDYTYALTQQGIQVLDVSDAAHPIQVGQYNRLVSGGSMAMVGTNLFLSTDAYFYVLDVSRGSNLVERAKCPASGTGGPFAMAGNYAYLPRRWFGNGCLTVINLADKYHPTNVAQFASPVGAQAVVAAEGNVWLAHSSGGCLTLSVANPLAPAYLGRWDDSGPAVGLAVKDNLVFAATREAGLQIIDLSQFQVRNGRRYYSRVGQWNTGCDTRDVAVSGDYVYLADGTNGLKVLNIHDPSAPALVAEQATPGEAFRVVVLGSYAYVADGTNGLEIFNVSTPGNPVRSGGYDTKGTAKDVAVSLGYAYVADGTNGLEIINVQNPALPQRVGGLLLDGDVSSVALDGHMAYVGSQRDGLHTLDISNALAPVRLGGNSVAGVGAVATSQHLVYIAAIPSIFVSSTYPFVMSPVDTLFQWRNDNLGSLPGGAFGPSGDLLADPDDDGVVNLFEYAFNLNPTSPDYEILAPGTGDSGLPCWSFLNGGVPHLQVEYLRRRNDPHLTYQVQFAPDLTPASWEFPSVTETVTPISADWERVVVADSPGHETDGTRFGRVRVEY